MDFRKAARIAISIVWCFSLLSSSEASVSGVRAVGAGAFPLSFTDASAWFADQSNETSKSLIALFYFQGSPGWLSENTDFKWRLGQSVATIDMTVGSVPIHVIYRQDTDEIELLGKRYSRASDNVFLIIHIDSSSPTVLALGSHNLTFKPDEVPSIALLRRDPDVWASVTGKAPSDHPRARLTASSQVLEWDAEGLRLLETGQPEQERRGCELFRRAAQTEYAPSQYRLGYCYESGKGVEQSFSKANDWYLKAGEQGFIDAQYKLGHSFRTGRGTPIDLATALKWYKKAASAGDRDALHNVGWMYATGQGTKVDQAEAYRWFLEGAKQGDPGSQFEVARRLKDGDGIQKDPKLAYSWLLVLNAQKSDFPPEDWKQIQSVMTSLEGELDIEAKKIAKENAQSWMGVIAKADMERYSRQ